MLVALFFTALVASALGSPSGPVLSGRGRGGDGLEAKAFTVQVRNGLSYVGPAALVNGQYVVCSASTVGNAKANSLSVVAGTEINFPFNPLAQTVKVSEILLHPDGADVAVLVLEKPVTIKSAASIAVVGPRGAGPGSRVKVSSWGFFKLAVNGEWLVLPKYCSAPGEEASGLCATGNLAPGALLVDEDDQLIGLASSKGQGSIDALASCVDLAEPTTQKFIAIATGGPTPTPPSPPTPTDPTTTPTPPSPSPSTPPTEAPKTETPAPPTTSDVPTSTPTPNPRRQTCSIRTNGGMPKQEPILLEVNANNAASLSFRDPDDSGVITLTAGDLVRLVCSGNKNYFTFNKAVQDVQAECVEDSTFRVSGQTLDWSDLGCKSVAYNSARRAGRCGNANEFDRVEIGFQVGSKFAVQYEDCFNSRTFDAVYSRMNMTPALAGHESGAGRPQFVPAGFYEGFDPNTLYKNNNQRTTIGQLLGDPSLGNKYVKPAGSSDHFLARGHLSAKADYILNAQQRATFYYINVAPQWQTFNAKNWEQLESSVRNWVVSSKRSVQVVTGTWGVATLPNVDGVETELYLGGSKKTLRVPKYYWKIVYDPVTKQGTAFVGMNNPYHETTDADILCQDECARYSWLTWQQKDQQQGYSFCCDVNEFKKVVTTVPAELDVQGLL